MFEPRKRRGVLPPTPEPPEPEATHTNSEEPAESPSRSAREPFIQGTTCIKVTEVQRKGIERESKKEIRRLMFSKTAIAGDRKQRDALVRRAIQEGKRKIIGESKYFFFVCFCELTTALSFVETPSKKLHLTKSIANCLSKTRSICRSHAAGAVVIGFRLDSVAGEGGRLAIRQHVEQLLGSPEFGFFVNNSKVGFFVPAASHSLLFSPCRMVTILRYFVMMLWLTQSPSPYGDTCDVGPSLTHTTWMAWWHLVSLQCSMHLMNFGMVRIGDQKTPKISRLSILVHWISFGLIFVVTLN